MPHLGKQEERYPPPLTSLPVGSLGKKHIPGNQSYTPAVLKANVALGLAALNSAGHGPGPFSPVPLSLSATTTLPMPSLESLGSNNSCRSCSSLTLILSHQGDVASGSPCYTWLYPRGMLHWAVPWSYSAFPPSIYHPFLSRSPQMAKAHQSLVLGRETAGG